MTTRRFRHMFAIAVVVALMAATSLPAFGTGGNVATAMAASASPATSFQIVDLGTLGGSVSYATGVNDNGQVVGESTLADDAQPFGGVQRAFSWTPAGGMVDLGTLGGSASYAHAVSPSGQVVGSAYVTGDAESHPFSWTAAGGMVDLGSLGGTIGEALAVNDSGQVVGYDSIGLAPTGNNQVYHAFSWTQAGGMVDLGTLGGTIGSLASAVNDSGQVVGNSFLAGYYTSGPDFQRAFSWTSAGGMVDLGTLGGSNSSAAAVNDSGQVVGSSDLAGDTSACGGSQRPISWTQAGGMVDLGTLGGSCASGVAVNDSGQVVGAGNLAGDASADAFSWTQAGGMIDLGTLGGCCTQAAAINGSGQVVGYSRTAGGEDHPFSWTEAGGMVDLGTLGGSPSYTIAVNAGGQVVGLSYLAGDAEQHATLWQPGASTAHLTVNAVASSKTYGAADPAFAYTLQGFAAGEDALTAGVTGSANCTRTAGETVAGGPYTITCAPGSLAAPHYDFTTGSPASFTITKAPLTVSAPTTSKILNAANPTLTPTYGGFVNGDSAASLTTQPTCSTTALTGSPVGSYPVTCSGGDAANYSFTYVPGTLSIIYGFGGFLQPINDTAHTLVCGSPCPASIFKGGSTIPVKFQLKDANGLVVQASSAPVWITPQKGSATSGAVDETVYSDPATPGTIYSWDGSLYHYNWSTKGFTTGYFWRIGVRFDDGRTYYVSIGLR